MWYDKTNSDSQIMDNLYFALHVSYRQEIRFDLGIHPTTNSGVSVGDVVCDYGKGGCSILPEADTSMSQGAKS
jgi:hypothetical protein